MEFFTARHPESANSLGLAIVLSSITPLLLLDEQLVVLAASGTFCRSFGVDPNAVMGKEMFALGEGEWDIQTLRSLLIATVSGKAAIDAYELTRHLRTGDQHLVLNAQLLDYGEEEPRLLLSITDVTAARILFAKSWSCSRSFSIVSPTAFRSSQVF
jgi:PAS domain-containing protein